MIDENIDEILDLYFQQCSLLVDANDLAMMGATLANGGGGGICAVVPGKMGIGVFSPLLDAKGNSVRGVKTCEKLSRDLGLHVLSAEKQERLGQLLPEFA